MKKLILILELLNALIRRLEFLPRDLKIALKIRNNSSRLIIDNRNQTLFLAKLSNFTIKIRSNASYLIYNLENIASAIKDSSNLFTKKDRNLHAVSNSLLSALTSRIKRELISSAIVAKANEVSTIRESRYYIILVYDNEASRDLLLMFIFVFAISVNLYQYRRSESERLITFIERVRDYYIFESN